jgi:hypothetical protein
VSDVKRGIARKHFAACYRIRNNPAARCRQPGFCDAISEFDRKDRSVAPEAGLYVAG